jgi:hypothetical protein
MEKPLCEWLNSVLPEELNHPQDTERGRREHTVIMFNE